MSDGTAVSRIERFLGDHPHGDLLVAVGYATPAGVAWLARRTRERRVSLLVGDARQQWWSKASSSDRAECLAFLRRPDVEVRNWYRTKRSRHGEASAHLKVWAVHDDWVPASALVGSGNLTRKGLQGNVEVMVEAHGADMRQAWDTARGVWGDAWKCDERLIGYLNGPEHRRGATPSTTVGPSQRTAAPKTSAPRRSEQPWNAVAAAAVIVVVVIVLWALARAVGLGG